jgi:hypothetical protein
VLAATVVVVVAASLLCSVDVSGLRVVVKLDIVLSLIVVDVSLFVIEADEFSIWGKSVDVVVSDNEKLDMLTVASGALVGSLCALKPLF